MTNYQTIFTGSEFLDGPMTETTSINYTEVIENVIHSLEHEQSGMFSHSPERGQLWKFKYGSVEIFVQLTGSSSEDRITVWATVLKLPAKDEPRLLRHLLELNCSTTLEARFGIIEDQVVVISIRTVAELSPSEISRLITIVATVADDYDEALQGEFGAP
jgi:hypothetical protein